MELVHQINPAFYHIFGFETSTKFGIYPASEITLSSPECLMALELCKDGLANIKGEVTYRMYEHYHKKCVNTRAFITLKTSGKAIHKQTVCRSYDNRVRTYLQRETHICNKCKM